MSKMKVAVIGCGNIANAAHIPAYMKNEEVEIKYFCDIILERAENCVEKYGCGTAVADYHDFLNDSEIDAVSVCTHNDFHSIIAIDFLKAGKHVFCEKPAARILSEALEMQNVAHETGKILNIGVVNRFNTYVMKIRELIDSGELGEVYHAYASFRKHRSIPGIGGDFTTKAKSGGGALIDWGVHFIDLIMYCCGDPKPVSASGEAFCKLGKDIKNYVYTGMWASETADVNGTYDVDDSVVGLVRTTGPVISFNGAWAQNVGEDEMFIDFMGDKAGARLTYGGKFEIYDGATLETISPEYDIPDQYLCEDKAFIESITTGVKDRNNIENILESMKLLEVLYESSNAGKEIEI